MLKEAEMHPRLHPAVSYAGITLLVGLALSVSGARDTVQSAGAPASFELAKIQLEQNSTDGDFEIVVEVMGGDEGLAKLTVVAPNGRKVVDLAGRDTLGLGMRQFRFETPEPKDRRSLQAAYPAGAYVFSGTTSSGATLHARATLSHQLPASSGVIQPAAGAKGVATRGIVLSWKPVAGVAAYTVYVEQEELDQSVSAKLPGSATSFVVPDGFLLPNTEYTVGVGTVMKTGNASVVETKFTTAAK
jgi:hypothetical protein